ncbi:MAG TPA: hypothetical protein VFT04_07615 [Gemmatimonadales bacterium]|nr:hypothetical protein [Gemmatimonadales bacterium]
MTEKPRDWDRELAEIDKVIARSPDAPPAGRPAVPAGRPAIAAGAPAPAPPTAGGPSRRGRGAAWMMTLLAVALGAAFPFWPYLHQCGFGLLGYAATVGLLILVSAWAGVSTWRHRLGLAHFLALVTLLWGLGLAAVIILPRIGYARTALTWDC